MSYLCLFPPCFGDAATTAGQGGQMNLNQQFFFPLKVKPMVCETECAGRTRSEAEADRDKTQTKTLFKNLIP